jgi:predicted nuclease with TOPRIM domain
MTIDQQFTIINEKLQQLLKQYSRLQKENERLRDELSDLKKKEFLFAQKMEEMQEQITILKVSSGELSEKDKKDFERKINQYIKEVDKCITFLSQ